MTDNQPKGSKFHIGQQTMTNFFWVMIRAYRYYNKGTDPEALVMPDIKEVNGVKIEYPKEDTKAGVDTKPRTGKTGK